MIGAILYKEWIKTARVIIFFSVVFLITLIQTYFDVKNSIEFYDATNVILNIINRAQFDFNQLSYKVIGFGLALAIAQFYPEINNARIRLYLHLPLSHTKLIWTLILSGLVTLSIGFIILIAGYYLIVSSYYPNEIYTLIFAKILPYFISSLLAYLACALAFVEPKLIKKIVYIIVTLLLISIYLALNSSGFFVTEYINYIYIGILFIYLVTLFDTFSSYTKGYIK